MLKTGRVPVFQNIRPYIKYKPLYKVLYFEGCSEGEGGSAEQTVTMKLKCCRRNILDSEDTFVIMLGQS